MKIKTLIDLNGFKPFEVSFELEMESESGIEKFQFEGPPGIACNQTNIALKCEWTPNEALWSLGKTHFCYTAFVPDIQLFFILFILILFV